MTPASACLMFQLQAKPYNYILNYLISKQLRSVFNKPLLLTKTVNPEAADTAANYYRKN